MCVCVARWLTSELRLCMLWRAGHPVELFSVRTKECKAATSPFSLVSAKCFYTAIEMLDGRECGSGRTGAPSKSAETSSSSDLKGEKTKKGSPWDSF